MSGYALLPLAPSGSHVLRFGILCADPNEATGPCGLWPRQGMHIEEEAALAIQAIKDDLVAGKRWWQRRAVHQGTAATHTVQREFFAVDAIGRETGEVVAVDATPVPWLVGGIEQNWPPLPAPFTVETRKAA